MMNGAGARGCGRAVIAAAVTAALPCITGCGSKPDYPPNLSFPSRTDRLVLKPPTATPTEPNTPGKIADELAALDAVGGRTADPGTVPAEIRNTLDRLLRDTFGTPGKPTLAGDAAVAASAGRLGLTPAELEDGGRLFRRQCQQCHNLSGDGRGPSGFAVPPPRDFRRGAFKFTSTAGVKPRRADLVRTITAGLPGTIMPAFGLLPENERDLLVRFVTYLAIRGQVEFEAFVAASSTDGLGEVASFVEGRTRSVLVEWERAENSPALAGQNAEPNDGDAGSPDHTAAVRRGYALFTAKADNACVTCHGDFGRKPVLRYDVWGTVAKPANLTDNNGLKGGKRGEDLFARVRGGIPAVGMPAHPEYSDRQVWDLVRFVQSVPYPARLPDDVRAAVYPSP